MAIKTYRDIVSRVRSSFKLISSDNVCSDRMILAEILSTNLMLVVRELQKRANWSSPNLFTLLECLDMEEIPLYTCCDTQSDCTIRRSALEVPQIVDCNYNLVINGVFGIDNGKTKGSTKFKELLNADRYSNYLKLYPEDNKKDKFYWIQNKHLYITDSNIEKVALNAFFVDPINPADYSCTSTTTCINPLDLEFKSLPKIEDNVVQIVFKKISDTYKRSIEDKSEDDLDTSK
jgi:hypothetical protein